MVPLIDVSVLSASALLLSTAIIRRLELTADKIAAIIGEHEREKVSEAVGRNLLRDTVLAATRSQERQTYLATQFARFHYGLLNSRAQKIESAKIGVELTARARYDLRATLSLRPQISVVSRGQSSPESFDASPTRDPSQRIVKADAQCHVVYEATAKL